MCDTKIKPIIVLLIFLDLQAGYGMPQGFFSQGLSIPKLVSWSNNDRSLTLLPNVKVESPVKSSFLNVFGKKNTIDDKDTSKNNIQNSPAITDQTKSNDQIYTNAQDVPKGGEGLISKFNAINENATDNQIDDTEITTEVYIETTTDEYETTTVDSDIFNRASPQLVASLLG